MILAFLSSCVLFSIPIGFGLFLMGKKSIRDISILLVAALAGYILWRLDSPYPYPLNWDIWEHQTVVNALLSGTFALLPSQLSDTFQFNGYTTMFHIWLAIPQYLFKPDVLGFWWFAEFFHGLTAALAAYLLTFAVSKNRWAAILSGVMSALFFESNLAYTAYFLMPQTITAVIWAFGFAFLLQKPKKINPVLIMFPLSVILISLHFIVGGLGIMVYFLYILLEKTRILEKKLIYLTAIISLPVFTFGILTLISRIFPVQTINFGEAGHFSNTLKQISSDMRMWYGLLPLFLLPFGIEYVEKNPYCNIGRILILCFLILGGVVISPFPYVNKFIVLWRFLLIPFISLGVMYFLDKTSEIIAKGIIIFLFVLTCQIISMENTNTWKQTVTYRGIASQLSDDERKTAAFLSEQKTKTALFVSDPATSYILEALSGMNSPGGAYMSTHNRNFLNKGLLSDESVTCNIYLNNIHDGLNQATYPTFIVITGRMLAWLKASEDMQQSNAWNVWVPKEFSLRDEIRIQKIQERCGFTSVFQTKSTVIFKRSI